MRRRTLLVVEPLEGRALLSGLSASLTTDQSVYQAGEPIEMTLTTTNTGNVPASFDYGPSFDGFIVTQGGQTVWQSNAGINPALAIAETLQPGASFTLCATWNGTIADDMTSTTTTGTFVVTNQLDPNGVSATFTIESPLSYSLVVPQPVVEFGQPIGFSYSITNISDQPVTFNLAPTNFTVTLANNGSTVWESNSQASTEPPASETLHPGQSVTETATWNGVANDGTLAGTNVWEDFHVAVAGSPNTSSEGFYIESPLAQTVSTDQMVYQPGQAIEMTATETNVSNQAITILNINDQFDVMGLDGVNVAGVNVSSSSPIVTLQPGQSQTLIATWNPSDVAGSTTNPSGDYNVYFNDNFQGTSPAEFVIESSSESPPSPPGGPSPNPPPSGGAPPPSQNQTGIALTLTTNHATNPRREPLEITVTLKNTARTRVKLAPDPSTTRLTIRDGSTVIWTKTLIAPNIKTLKPGQSLRLTTLWNGKPNRFGAKLMSPSLCTIEVDEGGSSASREIQIS